MNTDSRAVLTNLVVFVIKVVESLSSFSLLVPQVYNHSTFGFTYSPRRIAFRLISYSKMETTSSVREFTLKIGTKTIMIT